MSIHDGHRQRVKARFRKEGLDNFEEIRKIEKQYDMKLITKEEKEAKIKALLGE